VSILLPTSTNDQLYAAITRGEHAEYRLGQCIPFEKENYERVDPHCEITSLQKYGSSRAQSILYSQETKSSLSLPLLIGGKCVGVLNVSSKKMSSFPPGKIKALKILANTAASALENARLYTEIRKAEQNYRSIFENASEGIFQVNRQSEYLLVNPSMARIVGYDKPEDLVLVYAGIDYESLLGNNMEITGIERQISREDETKIWVSENVRAVRDERGQILYLEGTTEDITKRKEAERYEQELTRLDRLNLVGEMAASIGHEIRNPMTSVRGFLQMLSTKEDCRPYQGYYELMIEELDRANSIISDYLNMAKHKPLDLTPGMSEYDYQLSLSHDRGRCKL